MENATQETVQNESIEPPYTLDFLKHPEKDFKSQLLSYIQNRYADLLDEQDLQLLAKGDPESLASLSRKILTAYRSAPSTNSK